MAEAMDITQILREVSEGREGAFEELLPLVYDELRRLADQKLRFERPDHTLQPTALAHEAYMKLVDQSRVEWRSRAHFFAIASQAIRRILVDYARQHVAQKRGGGAKKLSFDEIVDVSVETPDSSLLALDRAIEKLAATHPDKARVVELRFFGGLTAEETAAVMEVGLRTVERYWEFSRAWLFREMSEADDESKS